MANGKRRAKDGDQPDDMFAGKVPGGAQVYTGFRFDVDRPSEEGVQRMNAPVNAPGVL